MVNARAIITPCSSAEMPLPINIDLVTSAKRRWSWSTLESENGMYGRSRLQALAGSRRM